MNFVEIRAMKTETQLAITVSKAVEHHLELLTMTGLYGANAVETAGELLRQKLREVILDGHCELGWSNTGSKKSRSSP